MSGIRAFSLFGEISLKGDSAVKSSLQKVSTQVNKTGKDMNSLKGHMSFGSGALSGLNSALGTLSNISNTIQGIPILGNLISGAVSTVAGPIKDMASLGLAFNDLKENSTIAFAVILKDGEKAKKLFDELAEFGRVSPIFKTSNLIGDAQLFLQEMGPGKELFETLKGIGALTASTGHLENMDRNMQTFKQIFNKPKLSAEEMTQQLPEAFVDGWGLLARARGQTVGEVMDLTTKGMLSGPGSAKVMIQQALREYGSIIDMMGQTNTGLESQWADTTEQLAGKGTVNLHGAYKGILQRGNAALNGPKGAQLAGTINDVTGDVAGRLLGGFDSLMDGSLLQKAQEATRNVVGTIQNTITGSTGAVYGAASDYSGFLIQGVKDKLGINSPSIVMEFLGMMAGEGFKKGLRESLETLIDDPRIQAMLDVIGKGEGTFDPKTGRRTYNKIFGGRTVALGENHPGIHVPFRDPRTGKLTSSTASGFGQFRQSTWNEASEALGGLTFSSEHDQQLAMVYLANKRGMLGPLAQGDIGTALKRGNEEWASLPGSPYKQPTQTMPAALSMYESRLATYANGVPVTNATPMPVSIVAFGNVKDFGSAKDIFGPNKGLPDVSLKAMQDNIKMFGDAGELTKRLDIAKSALKTNEEGAKKMFADKPEVLARVQKMNEDAFKIGDEAAKAVPSLAKLGETAALTAEQLAANRKESDLQGSAQRRDKHGNPLG